MALSQQLRAIANKARGSIEQQAAVGQAQVGAEAGQAMGQTAQAGPKGKAVSQQLAGGITGAQQQVATQAAGAQQQLTGQLGQQALQQTGAAQQQSLVEQQQINEKQISDLQRSGQLRQNSAALKQSKQLQKTELAMQNRLTSAKMEYDGKLSFMTRKQREDLARMDAVTKQMLFDQRLTFQKSEADRRFSNMRQLADYSILSQQNEQNLADRMREMEQSAARGMTALQHAHNMITSKMEQEFQRAEKNKDYALLIDLQKKKAALDEKLARKAASASMTRSIIVGTFTIAGAVIGAYAGQGVASGATAAVGAQGGAAVGEAVAGGVEAS